MTATAAPDRIVGLYSFPKSGNTWLRAIIAGITEIPTGAGMMQRYVTDSHYGRVLENPWKFQGVNWYFYKSHHKTVLTEHMGDVFDTDQVIYIYRHPLDVFTSYLNFVSANVSPRAGRTLPVQFNKVEDLTAEELEILFAIFLKHATLFPKNKAFGNVFEHYENFRALREAGRPVHMLSYEALSDNFKIEVYRICAFLGIDNVRLNRVYNLADKRTRQNGKFFWKRQKENFRNYLSKDQIARFEAAHGDRMAAMGYPPA